MERSLLVFPDFIKVVVEAYEVSVLETLKG